MATNTNLKSLLARLRNQARKRKLPGNLMLLFYFQERFVARVSVSSYYNQLILKGGLNLYGRYGNAARPTRDIDLAGQHLAHTEPAVAQAIATIAEIDLNDGVIFDSQNIKAYKIIESANYTGIRVELKASFESAFEILQLDISFGNAITPSPVELSFPSLLTGEEHRILAYPLESIIAEKVAAAIEIGVGNTRLKDFYDLYWIFNNEQIKEPLLAKALSRSFKARGTPDNGYQTLKLLDTPKAQEAWESFLNQNPVEAPKSFKEVLKQILKNLETVLEP